MSLGTCREIRRAPLRLRSVHSSRPRCPPRQMHLDFGWSWGCAPPWGSGSFDGLLASVGHRLLIQGLRRPAACLVQWRWGRFFLFATLCRAVRFPQSFAILGRRRWRSACFSLGRFFGIAVSANRCDSWVTDCTLQRHESTRVQEWLVALFLGLDPRRGILERASGSSITGGGLGLCLGDLLEVRLDPSFDVWRRIELVPMPSVVRSRWARDAAGRLRPLGYSGNLERGNLGGPGGRYPLVAPLYRYI